MFENEVRPRIATLLGRGGDDTCREWVFAGIGESEMAAALEYGLARTDGLEYGYCAGPSTVRLRGVGPGIVLAEVDRIVQEAFPHHLVSGWGETMEEVVVRLLTERRQWVSTAESCTGGLVAHRLTNVPGASAVLGTGVVTYSNEAKTRMLGVPEGLLREHGAVSSETAESMAEGCLEMSEADWAVSVTGIAGPSGGSPEKPVGTVWIAVAGKGVDTVVQPGFFPVDRETFKQRASEKALDLVRRRLLGIPV
jgi:nicotinamide-nucleotide amidase